MLLAAIYLFFPKDPKLTICAIFKNEAPWLKEWIDYHHDVLGVRRFYLYNNDSTDHYEEVLKPYINQGLLELIEWSSMDSQHATSGPFMDAPWSPFQLGAYNDCLKNRALGHADWVAMIDIDEFIVPSKGVKAFYQLLRTAKKSKKGTVRLFWRVFGTSNISYLQPGDRLLEKLTWRSKDDHPWNQNFKSIHQPKPVGFCLVHEAQNLKAPYRKKTVAREEATVHHYWTRTEQFCLQKRGISSATDPEFFQALHQVQDEAATKL